MTGVQTCALPIYGGGFEYFGWTRQDLDLVPLKGFVLVGDRQAFLPAGRRKSTERIFYKGRDCILVEGRGTETEADDLYALRLMVAEPDNKLIGTGKKLSVISAKHHKFGGRGAPNVYDVFPGMTGNRVDPWRQIQPDPLDIKGIMEKRKTTVRLMQSYQDRRDPTFGPGNWRIMVWHQEQ